MTTAERIYHQADNNAEGWQERCGYRLDSGTFARERNEPIGVLFRYWLDRAQDGLPNSSTFDPMNSLSDEIVDRISYVDCLPGIRYGWVFNRHKGVVFGKFEQRAIADYPILDHRIALLSEYDSIRAGRRPRFDEIVQEYGGAARHYKRLILPVADDSGDVTRLWIATRVLRSSSPAADPR